MTLQQNNLQLSFDHLKEEETAQRKVLADRTNELDVARQHSASLAMEVESLTIQSAKSQNEISQLARTMDALNGSLAELEALKRQQSIELSKAAEDLKSV